MQFIGTGDRILTENFNVGYLYTITFKTGIYINSACIGIGDTFVMFQKAEPDLLFTLNVDTADEVDTIELYDSGGGSNDYDDLVNRPQINSHTLSGNMSGSDLGLQDTISDLDTIRAGAAAGATAVQPAALSDYQPLISDLDTIRAGATAGATAVQPADMTTALATKQDALSTAQLAAVNSGITSADVAQIETNKNNISSLRAYGGLKNYATINNGTYTANSGGGTHSITIPLLNPITGDIVISIGNITSNDVDSSTCAFVFGNDVTSQDTVAVSRGDNINVPVSMGTFVATKVQIYPAATYQASGGDTVSWADLMICTKEDWDNSHDYQPYAMSNAEITAWILAHS